VEVLQRDALETDATRPAMFVAAAECGKIYAAIKGAYASTGESQAHVTAVRISFRHKWKVSLAPRVGLRLANAGIHGTGFCAMLTRTKS